MADSLTRAERSQLMAKVRAKGNRSTEVVVEAALRLERISGWRKHPKKVMGSPDFYFPRYRIAVFVDGCFWHACPNCGRIPKTNVEFWSTKIDENRRRDNRVRRRMRQLGLHVVRVWEHEVRTAGWIGRLRRMIEACQRS